MQVHTIEHTHKQLCTFRYVLLLSQYQANLRILYIGLLYHVFAFLNKYPNMGQLSYVSNTKDIEEAYFFSNVYCTVFNYYVEEKMSPRILEPWGNSLAVLVFVDVKNAGKVVVRRCYTEIIVYFHNSPIVW